MRQLPNFFSWTILLFRLMHQLTTRLTVLTSPVHKITTCDPVLI